MGVGMRYMFKMPVKKEQAMDEILHRPPSEPVPEAQKAIVSTPQKKKMPIDDEQTSLQRTFDFEENTIAHPPRTWASYLNDMDHWGIVDMEFNEARLMMEKYRSGACRIEDVIQELGHLASASALARSYMLDHK